MKKCIAIGLILLSAFGICLCSVQIQAKTKKKTLELRPVIIEKNVNYRWDRLVNYYKYDMEGLVKLQKLIKKRTKLTVSGKGLTIKKKIMKVKKTGTYCLVIKTKKNDFKLPVVVVNRYYKIDPKRIVKMRIRRYGKKGYPSADVTDAATIRVVLNNINYGRYRFEIPKRFGLLVGFEGMSLECILENGEIIKKTKIYLEADTITDRSVMKFTTVFWRSEIPDMTPFYNFLMAVYECACAK